MSSGVVMRRREGVDNKGEVIHANILLTSGSKVKIQEAPTQILTAHSLIVQRQVYLAAKSKSCSR